MKRPRHRWTREDTILALDLYFRIPDEEVRDTHPEIRRIAKLIGVDPGSVRMKISNFRCLDPEKRHKNIAKLAHNSQPARDVWAKFSNNRKALMAESARIIAEREGEQ